MDEIPHLTELVEPHGGIDPRITSPTPGVQWLHRIADHFDRSVWINPDKKDIWEDYRPNQV